MQGYFKQGLCFLDGSFFLHWAGFLFDRCGRLLQTAGIINVVTTLLKFVFSNFTCKQQELLM